MHPARNLIVAALLAVAAFQFVSVGRGAEARAVRAASTYQPQAHWTVVDRTFDPWAKDVQETDSRVHLTGGAGPAWVVILTAPDDRTWKTYRAVVVINATTGEVAAASVYAGT